MIKKQLLQKTFAFIFSDIAPEDCATPPESNEQVVDENACSRDCKYGNINMNKKIYGTSP